MPFFSPGDSFIVALTSPVKRDSRGGIEIEKITKALTVTAQSGEEPHHGIDCGWPALGPAGDPVIAFYNPQNEVVRGYFAAKDRIFVARWTAKREDCQYHSD
jgi:hypothetical protein